MKYESLSIINGCHASWITHVEGQEWSMLLEIYSAEVQKTLSIPGFRSGKAPLGVVAATVGDRFYTDAANQLFPAIYNQSVLDQELSPVADPVCRLIRCDQEGFAALMEVDVYPQVKLGEYRGLEVPRPDDSVSDEEMELEIQRYRENHKETRPIPRQSGEDDLVYFSMNATADGEPFFGSAMSGVLQRFAAKDLYPGLKEHLRGASVGDEIRYEIRVPEDDPRTEIAGKRLTMALRVDEIKERRLRQVDDALFAPVYSSREDYVQKRRLELQKIRRLHADEVFEKNLKKALSDRVEANIPNSLIDRETGRMLANLSRGLDSEGGITGFMEETGKTAEEIREQVKALAIDHLRFQLAIDAVAAAEGIQEEDDDRREKKAFAIVKASAHPLPEGSAQ